MSRFVADYFNNISDGINVVRSLKRHLVWQILLTVVTILRINHVFHKCLLTIELQFLIFFIYTIDYPVKCLTLYHLSKWQFNMENVPTVHCDVITLSFHSTSELCKHVIQVYSDAGIKSVDRILFTCTPKTFIVLIYAIIVIVKLNTIHFYTCFEKIFLMNPGYLSK